MTVDLLIAAITYIKNQPCPEKRQNYAIEENKGILFLCFAGNSDKRVKQTLPLRA